MIPPIARHGRLPRSRPWATVLRFVATTLAVVLVSAGAVAGYAVYDVAKSVRPGVKLIGQTDGPPRNIGSFKGGINVLVAASDSGGGDVGTYGKRGEHLNDVTMLLHISADHSSATVVSFPRDLVSIPLCGKGISNAMFNTTLARGLSCTVQTVEKMTGLTIPYAGVITFNGVTGMSNAVGGVTVCLATPIKDPYTDPQLDLAAGHQTLVGDTALSFLRSRHGVGDGSDLGRISNQQVFLSALTRKIVSDGVLSNPLTLYKLANSALANVRLSDTLTNPSTLVSIALAIKGVDLRKIVFVQYPTGADPADPNRVVPLVAPAAALFAALKTNQAISLTGKLGRAAVADPSAVATPTPTPSGSATAAPSAAPAPTTIALPPTITGQRADQNTCTEGFTNRK